MSRVTIETSSFSQLVLHLGLTAVGYGMTMDHDAALEGLPAWSAHCGHDQDIALSIGERPPCNTADERFFQQ